MPYRNGCRQLILCLMQSVAHLLFPTHARDAHGKGDVGFNRFHATDLVVWRLLQFDDTANGAPGWHLHFVDAERQHGGHVVNFSLRKGELRYCYANDYQIRLPDAATLVGLNLARDWSEELKRAEAER